MTKNELIAAIADETGKTKTDVSAFWPRWAPSSPRR
jgi:nucleoid DNA-binding protein